jgi:lysozyme
MPKQQQTVFIIIIMLLLGLYVTNRFYFSKQPVLYPNFGIEVPAGYTTHGIDVSHYQHDVDWDLVTKMVDRGQKISFAIVKATEGNNLLDDCFKTNWNELEHQPILRGAYLYLHANKNGKSQALYFISKVNLKKGDLPPIIDIEETKGMKAETIQKVVKDCADALEKEYDCKPIIYSNVDFYDKKLGSAFDPYPLWAAHYEQKQHPQIERDWIMWQHSSKGRVNGIDASVDFNVVNGSIFALQELCLR